MQHSHKKRCQKGGGSSDYVQSFHAYAADPAQLSVFTLQNINRAPMFNPLSANTVIPTGTSGVIPTGAYYNSIAPTNLTNIAGPPTPGAIQMGGRNGARHRSLSSPLYVTRNGKSISNPWIAHVYRFAETHDISYSQALKDSRVKSSYVKSNSK